MHENELPESLPAIKTHGEKRPPRDVGIQDGCPAVHWVSLTNAT